MDHQLWINNDLRLDAQPEKMHESGPKWDSLHPFIAFLLFQKAGGAIAMSFMMSGGLACKRDVAAPCQPASQPSLGWLDRAVTMWWMLRIWHRTISSVRSWKHFFLSWLITSAIVSVQDKDRCVQFSSKSEYELPPTPLPQTKNIASHHYQPRTAEIKWSWNLKKDNFPPQWFHVCLTFMAALD